MHVAVTQFRKPRMQVLLGHEKIALQLVNQFTSKLLSQI